MFSPERAGPPSSRAWRNLPKEEREVLEAVVFQDRRVARAIHRVPWEPFESSSCFTAEQLNVIVRMLEALSPSRTENVLDVGTGSAYRAALLGALAGRVCSIEILPKVAAAARERLDRLGYRNVEIVHGDGSCGWAAGAPFQAIVVGGALPDVPHALIDQLSDGGRLVVPMGDAQGQLIERLCRHDAATIESTTIAPCRLRPLVLPRERRASVPWLPPQPSSFGARR
jgi:protein-L-isoaspartate(D-aspartate) O-methyltransferase